MNLARAVDRIRARALRGRVGRPPRATPASGALTGAVDVSAEKGAGGEGGVLTNGPLGMSARGDQRETDPQADRSSPRVTTIVLDG